MDRILGCPLRTVFRFKENLARQTINILFILYIHVNSQTGIALAPPPILQQVQDERIGRPVQDERRASRPTAGAGPFPF